MISRTVNYLRSLAQLSPSEIQIADEDVFVINSNAFGYKIVYTKNDKLSDADQDRLLPYLLRCIGSKGWEAHLGFQGNYTHCFIVINEKIGCSKSSVQGHSPDLCRAEAVLQAYVKALVSQRTVTGGAWEHFKGDRVEVVCCAYWDSGAYLDDYEGVLFIGSYVLEDEPSKSVKLYKNPLAGNWFYISESAIMKGDRVFYSHSGKSWARLKSSFLGVVGPEHPEHEGRLRFAGVLDRAQN
jgi:hypothetical protein